MRLSVQQKVIFMKIRVHVLVTGRVQGVFFRSETSRRASLLEVTGWVRNLQDGRVEVVFEGERENVRELVEFCKRGPSGAKVERVEVTHEDYSGNFKDFKIVW